MGGDCEAKTRGVIGAEEQSGTNPSSGLRWEHLPPLLQTGWAADKQKLIAASQASASGRQKSRATAGEEARTSETEFTARVSQVYLS